MAYAPIRDVKQFMKACDQNVREHATLDVPQDEKDLRIELIREEFEEFVEGLEEDNIVKVADGLGDMLYVIYGAAHTFGIDIEAVFNEIQDSNLSKLGDDGKAIKRADGKVLKGPGYFPPDLSKALQG